MDIKGRNLGLESAVVTVVYSGGSLGMATRTYTVPSGNCTVLNPGLELRCQTLPGVGANYTFVVVVNGSSSAPSANMLSYSAPLVNSVDGPGAVAGLAAGGALVVLRGVRVHQQIPYPSRGGPQLGGYSCA